MAVIDAMDSLRANLHVRLSGIWVVAVAACAAFCLLLVVHDISAPRVFGAIAFVLVVAGFAHVAVRRNAANTITPQAEGGAFDTALLDGIIAALPDAAMVLDQEGRVVALNARAKSIAPALRRDEPASLALRMPEVIEAIRRVTLDGQTQRVEFFERVPSDRWSEAFITPMPLQSGNEKSDFLLVSFHDLTPLRRVEEMRADFVANASHELRTPLAALSGFIETLRGAARDDPAARERFLGIMEKQAHRMARLIDDLLSLSRIELNAHLRPDKPVDLMSIVRQVIDAMQTLAADRGVEIKIIAPFERLIVPGDRDELIRVFENLVENALKYGGSGKRVEVEFSHLSEGGKAKEAVVAVRDYGPGIAVEHLPRLTERFYRVDVAGSRALGGTGLGLALVKHVLNRHRGRLSIESKAGQGATFTVRLPAA